MKRNEYILISLINLVTHCAYTLCNTDVNTQSRVGLVMNLPPDRYHTKGNTELEKQRELIHFELAGDTDRIVAIMFSR